jgi:hypothetical protein
MEGTSGSLGIIDRPRLGRSRRLDLACACRGIYFRSRTVGFDAFVEEETLPEMVRS